MDFYTWEETRSDIYGFLPEKSKIEPGPKFCLLHEKELKKTYDELESALRDTVFPWHVKDIHKVVYDNVCCCPPRKRKIKACCDNLPSELQELKHWETYEDTMNELNSDDSYFPQEAKTSLHKIMDLHLDQNIPHYEILLKILLNYINKPYRDYFKVNVQSEEQIQKAFGSGDFLLKMYEIKYNIRVLYLYEENTVTFICAARCFTDFKKLQAYILNQINGCGSKDTVVEDSSTNQIKLPEVRSKRKKTSPKVKVKNLVFHKKAFTNISRAKSSHNENELIYKKRNALRCTKRKQCGLLKPFKRDVSYITKLNVKDPTHKDEHLTSEELEMLHIMMGDEINMHPPHQSSPLFQDGVTSEELEMLHIMINDEINSELFKSFKFGKKQEGLKHRVELNINLTSSEAIKVLPEEPSNKIVKTEVQFELSTHKLGKAGKVGVPQLTFDYKRSFSNHVWVLILLYFTLLGFCFVF